MNKQKIQSFLSKKWLSWLLQAAFLILFIFAFNWWQQRDMLSDGDFIKNTELNLATLNSETYQYQLDNEKNDTLIYFFAPWCGICHLSIDNLEDIYQSKPENLDILVVALDWQSQQEIQEFIDEHKLSMPVLLGNNQTQLNFKISAFPSYYLISKKGEVLSKDVGYSTQWGIDLRLAANRKF